MREVRHPEFLAFAAFQRFVPGIAGRTERLAAPDYEWLCNRTLAFLQAALGGGDTEAVFRGNPAYPVTVLAAQPD
jgi:hypothetical protein